MSRPVRFAQLIIFITSRILEPSHMLTQSAHALVGTVAGDFYSDVHVGPRDKSSPLYPPSESLQGGLIRGLYDFIDKRNTVISFIFVYKIFVVKIFALEILCTVQIERQFFTSRARVASGY